MTFRITALDPGPFTAMFDLDDTALAARGARRVVADKTPGFPCRVSLADAEPGETLILVNHEHLPGNTPYAQRHAIYVRKSAVRAEPEPGELPTVLRGRPISVRAYDADSMLVGADLCHGRPLEPVIEALFERADVAFIHLHNAMHGCFAAAAHRA